MKNYDLVLTCTACGYNGPTNCDEDDKAKVVAHCDNCGYSWTLKGRKRTKRVWMTDEEISELIGAEWQTEMDVSSGVYEFYGWKSEKGMSKGKRMMLHDANTWLDEHNKDIQVRDVRENKTGDFLDWSVEFLAKA